MIVITSINRTVRLVQPGDKFVMHITDDTGSTVLVEEEITCTKIINFVASYRFALEDGTCPGFHLCGIFGNSAELPKEIVEAVNFHELPAEKQARFLQTVGIKLKGAT